MATCPSGSRWGKLSWTVVIIQNRHIVSRKSTKIAQSQRTHSVCYIMHNPIKYVAWVPKAWQDWTAAISTRYCNADSRLWGPPSQKWTGIFNTWGHQYTRYAPKNPQVKDRPVRKRIFNPYHLIPGTNFICIVLAVKVGRTLEIIGMEF